jgi:hypothetical protein
VGCAFSGSSIVFPLSINNEITGGEKVVMLSAMVLDTPDYEPVSLNDTSQELAAQPSDTRTIEPSWSHAPMQATLLDLPEPQAGPFTEPLTEPIC